MLKIDGGHLILVGDFQHPIRRILEADTMIFIHLARHPVSPSL
jgi:hypothetical protein